MVRLARIGNVEINLVENEQPRYANEVTEKPVESGQNIADHVRKIPDTMVLPCVISGNDWREKRAQLHKYRDEATVIMYRGKIMMLPVVIESMIENHDRFVANGYAYTITLKQMRFAVQQTEILQAPDPVNPNPPAGAGATTTQTQPVKPPTREQIQEIGANNERIMAPPIAEIYGPSIFTMAANASASVQRQDALNRVPLGR